MSRDKFGGLGIRPPSKRGADKKLAAFEGQPEGPSSLSHLSPAERFAKVPQWFATNEVPPREADPDGYMKMVARGDPVISYANILGVQPWVTHVLKKVLHWRYIHHSRTPSIDFRRPDDKNRLTDEINITFRNYATTLNQLLRDGQVPPHKLESKMQQYEAMEELSAKIYKMGSYRISGYFLYKIGEELLKEIIVERRAIEAGLIDAKDVVPGKPTKHTSKPRRVKLKFRDEGSEQTGDEDITMGNTYE
ncbi:uncharacterized protein DFL_003747 [Arthrobotrys flagrans]|uniref:Uncharacterized protein n=1 Tax=Arthrobotrys flagrans TaxID=97331 RepID=A0A437A2S2_ARTFL|nr:hypothetical protein DFL_003747 [Arthrobotrys flagrans]